AGLGLGGAGRRGGGRPRAARRGVPPARQGGAAERRRRRRGGPAGRRGPAPGGVHGAGRGAGVAPGRRAVGVGRAGHRRGARVLALTLREVLLVGLVPAATAPYKE